MTRNIPVRYLRTNRALAVSVMFQAPGFWIMLPSGEDGRRGFDREYDIRSDRDDLSFLQEFDVVVLERLDLDLDLR
jgi:hypothetical protein